LDETLFLEREIVDRIEKEMSRRAHFLESFSQKRDEIIEYTPPTFQGRQKMIKCVRSSRKDLAALERDRTKERESDRRLFSSRLVLFRSPESWGFRGVREIAGEKKTIIIIIIIIVRKRSDLFFFFFFLSDCSNGFDSIFLSLSTKRA
jgi:hypothetical protein